MNVIDLLEEMGLKPKRLASTSGGEYHSSCPDSACGGSDRFCVWPSQDKNGRYWCRQCQKKGDAIQFCRDFMGMDFSSACEKVGRQPIHSKKTSVMNSKEGFTSKLLQPPLEIWVKRASSFLKRSQQYLINNPHLLNQDKDRGLVQQSIIDFQLGWNPSNIFESRHLWGLPDMSKEGGSNLMCIPQGIVISSFREDILIRLKIRRHNWKLGDEHPKYHIVVGSTACPVIYGDISKPIVIVESELDAMLIQQLAADICCCIALGGVSIKPDVFIDLVLRKSPIILYALDFDEAGKKAFYFWQSTYPLLKPWPVPKGKSPGDAHSLGVDLYKWIKIGLQRSIV